MTKTKIHSLLLVSILLSFTPYKLIAQAVHISWHEKRWALFHPIAAIKVKRIAKQCAQITACVETHHNLDHFKSGGKLDAYRHVFYMAAFAKKVNPKKIKKLGVAHEKTNFKQFKRSTFEDGEVPDSVSCEMDLKNNAFGIALGRISKSSNLQELSDLVLLEIEKGKAWIMKRNTAGNYLSCDEQTIDLTQYKGVWAIPKCLVPSNYHDQ